MLTRKQRSALGGLAGLLLVVGLVLVLVKGSTIDVTAGTTLIVLGALATYLAIDGRLPLEMSASRLTWQEAYNKAVEDLDALRRIVVKLDDEELKEAHGVVRELFLEQLRVAQALLPPPAPDLRKLRDVPELVRDEDADYFQSDLDMAGWEDWTVEQYRAWEYERADTVVDNYLTEDAKQEWKDSRGR